MTRRYDPKSQNNILPTAARGLRKHLEVQCQRIVRKICKCTLVLSKHHARAKKNNNKFEILIAY